jgi:hypothetical protein
MAKKQQRKITVKNPKIGNNYYFNFAGSTLYGPITEKCINLSKNTGIEYFQFTVIGDPQGTKYPVSIHEIAKAKNDLR